MGSSFSALTFAVPAVLCGIVYLLFDAARYLSHHLSLHRLRRLTGSESDPTRGSSWYQYSPERFSLITGALLQVALVGAVGFTVLALGIDDPVRNATMSIILWAGITLAWKFALVLVPEEQSEAALRVIIPISTVFYWLFWPILAPLRWLFMLLSDRRSEDEEEEISEEEVQAYIDTGEEEGIFEEDEGKLVQSIVDFGDRIARELMTPRVDIVGVEVKSSLHDLAEKFIETKYSRIPLYDQNIDAIVAIVHVKDVFEALLRGEKKPILELARPPYFIHETKKVSQLLREFQLEHLQIAVVVDEYGGTSGIVTIEDVIEEIVGEIADEHEDEEEAIVNIADGVYLVNGLVRVETLEDLLEVEISSDDYETVAGLMITELGRVPKAGEVVTKNGVEFEVERADRKRVYRIRVRMREQAELSEVE